MPDRDFCLLGGLVDAAAEEAAVSSLASKRARLQRMPGGKKRAVVGLGLAVLAPALLAGCTEPGSVGLGSPGMATVAAPGSCHVRGSGREVLPDPSCTPGATDPDVTQADIAGTICRPGWTKTVRPPVSYTNDLKRQQMAAYGDSGPMGSYEEDHLVSLELGGAPSDPRNLWPEPGASPNPKDQVENAANQAVCSSSMSLADAQQAIAGDWISFGRRLGVEV